MFDVKKQLIDVGTKGYIRWRSNECGKYHIYDEKNNYITTSGKCNYCGCDCESEANGEFKRVNDITEWM
ncbi:MAG TPA: hypothetical protein GX708_05190 [Gallicola sp.]|nr:hypothetical protein [Gallicola sp.]